MEKLHFLSQNRERYLHVQFEGTVGQQTWEEFSLFCWNPYRKVVFPPRMFLSFSFDSEMPTNS